MLRVKTVWVTNKNSSLNLRFAELRRRVSVSRTMQFRQPAMTLFILFLPLAARAEPESDVRNAVSALANTSYDWETTTRQRFSGDTTEPRVNLDAPIETKGRIEPNAYTEITLMPSRELAVPVTAITRAGDVVGHTPLGWMRRTEMRQTADANRMVEFEGKQVRLSRVFSAALRVTAQRTPTEELFDLLADVKSYRNMEGLVLAELQERVVEQLWGDARAKRAPAVQGNVIFKFAGDSLSEYHVVLAIGFPNSRTKKTAWSMVQWSTRFRGIGSTTVEPPAAAVKALE